MRAVKFKLKGRNAFFKKPEVNTYCYFTYGQIHKMALLGIFGAILGYDGYGIKKQERKAKGQPTTEEYPEFYRKLKDLKICVIPENEQGYIPKKIQQYNNSVGYASAETGGNLIVKEQWLENPEWEIYFMIDSEEAELLADFLINSKCIYIPYLGRNNHIADIEEVERVSLKEIYLEELQISSMFPKSIGSILLPDDEDEIEPFKYEEKLPSALNGYTNLYEYQTFCYTNLPVKIKEIKETVLYQDKNKILAFY